MSQLFHMQIMLQEVQEIAGLTVNVYSVGLFYFWDGGSSRETRIKYGEKRPANSQDQSKYEVTNLRLLCLGIPASIMTITDYKWLETRHILGKQKTCDLTWVTCLCSFYMTLDMLETWTKCPESHVWYNHSVIHTKNTKIKGRKIKQHFFISAFLVHWSFSEIRDKK